MPGAVLNLAAMNKQHQHSLHESTQSLLALGMSLSHLFSQCSQPQTFTNVSRPSKVIDINKCGMFSLASLEGALWLNIFKLFFTTERLGNYSWLMTVRFSCNHLISGARLLNTLHKSHGKRARTGNVEI